MFFLKYIEYLNKFINIIISLLLGIMVIVVFAQVFTRFITNFNIYISIPWTLELSRYLMIWMVFLGSGVAARYAQQLSVDAFIQMTPAFFGKSMATISQILSVVFYFFIIRIGIESVQNTLDQSSPIMNISIGYIYLSIVVGSFIMLLNTIAFLV